MYCKKCGAQIEEGANFCGRCGNPVSEEHEESNGEKVIQITEKNNIMKQSNPDLITNIILIVAGGLLLIWGFQSMDYDWGVIQFLTGVTFLVKGILQLISKYEKGKVITTIVMGSLLILIGFSCDLEYDWGYSGLLAGAALLVTGILELLHKSLKAIGILEIVFGSILLLYGIACADFTWGDMGLISGIALLVPGILRMVSLKKSFGKKENP